MIFLITQRLIETEYGDERECLEVHWHDFAAQIRNIQLIPISYRSNIDDFNFTKIDGIILSGGNNLSSLTPGKEINKKRDAFEIQLYRTALARTIPVFAVCRGAQLLAEYHGATIRKINNHVNCKHDITIVENVIQIPKQVNSYHNYGIFDLEGQQILAYDEHGHIEAFMCPGALCCMWHPERHPQDFSTFKQYFGIKDVAGIVLCAGQGTRLRPLTNYVPKCMVKYKDVRIINYCLNALTTQIDKENITFVTGYLHNKLQMKPVKKIFSNDYASTNMLTSLFLALDSGPVVISYSDIVYHPDIVEKLVNSNHDISVVVDHDWLQQWSQRMENPLDDVETLRFDAEGLIMEIGNVPKHLDEVEAQYIGLIKLSQRGVDIFKQVAAELDITNMSVTPFLQEIIRRGHKIHPVHIHGGWAEFDCPTDLSIDIDTSWYTPTHFFGTKASNIKRLAKMEPDCVFPHYSFTISEWYANQPIEDFLKHHPKVIVRSSAIGEDSITESNAGMYDSVVATAETYKAAVSQVIASYPTENEQHQVLVQPFAENATLFGVVFSHVIDTHAPYYVVSYGDTFDGVTGGYESSTFYHYHGYGTYKFEWECSLYELIKKCQSFFNHLYLDIEFCVLSDNTVKLLQIRPLTTSPIFKVVAIEPIHETLRMIMHEKHDTLYGDKTFFDNMSDWNPAEMIGTVPTRLAASLYEELITDKVALQSRASYGYKDVSMHPLMVNIHGAYYMDIRVVFNSYLPAKTDHQVAKKLFDYYMQTFSKNIHLRDKVEFEVLYTCFDPNIDLSHILSESEASTFKQLLLGISQKAFSKIDLELGKIEYLNNQIEQTSDVCEIIQLCKDYGTTPFSGLARTAFIATTILKSLSKSGHFTKPLPYVTVSSEIVKHKQMVIQGELCSSIFKHWYGHLRPGTYNLLTPSYKKGFDIYFPELNSLPQKVSNIPAYPYRPGQTKFETPEHVQAYLRENGCTNTENFFNCAVKAIEGREYAKFIFTKCVSKILDIIGDDFDRQFWDIKYIMTNKMSNVRYWRDEHQTAINRVNPNTILSEKDIFHISYHEETPTFVSEKIITKNITDEKATELRGKIVLIKAADPGYDWLFSRGIAGFITCYGGANSHMVIRANELNLPAAVGVGEKKFNTIKRHTKIVLDCRNKTINLL